MLYPVVIRETVSKSHVPSWIGFPCGSGIGSFEILGAQEFQSFLNHGRFGPYAVLTHVGFDEPGKGFVNGYG